MSKYQVGDKIHVEFEIAYVGVQTMDLTRGGHGANKHVIAADSPYIVKHTPKPWEPKVGDVVTTIDRVTKYRIMAISDDQVWLRYEDSTPYYCTASIDRLQLWEKPY